MRRFGDELNEVAQEMVGRSVSDLNRCIRPCPKGCGRGEVDQFVLPGSTGEHRGIFL